MFGQYRVKKILFVFIFSMFFSSLFGLKGQTGWSGGVVVENGIHYFTDKLGFGVNFTTPHIINQSAALTATYLYHSFRGIDTTNTNSTLWVHYHTVKAGFQFLSHARSRFRPLSEIGWLGRWSNGTNGQQVFVQGMYMSFGFELFWKKGWSSKITLGGDAIMEDTPSVDSRIQNEPYYSNGLVFSIINQFYLP